ncbi:Fic family protein [Macrococcus bovicus]|uniref:Fic family protein n=1 Tax=Macrococcus bovicus TaxID=69968 RepID=UPI0025A6455E|nr:Fic family protein [Macrococcus bovicus]WJP96754.1 Fic family protein [Macrococcus bovicus]
MKLSADEIQGLRAFPNAGYEKLKIEFLFHSNKMEGSTFSREEILKVIKEKQVSGIHSLNDIYETKNSIDLFEYVVETAHEPLSERLIKEYHAMLLQDSHDIINKRLAGRYRPVPAEIYQVDLKLSDPVTIDSDMEQLMRTYNKTSMDLEDIAVFHKNFGHIHPFNDGNGRVGRFIMLKQCIEHNIDLIAIDSEYEKEYKDSLFQAQKHGEMKDLVKVLEKCQERLDKKFLDIEITKIAIHSLLNEKDEPEEKHKSDEKIRKRNIMKNRSIDR